MGYLLTNRDGEVRNMTLPNEKNLNLWFAILHELTLAGGEAPPRLIIPRMREYFQDITDEDVSSVSSSGKNQWETRIFWARYYLVQRGCIDNSIPGLWKITQLGRDWLEENWRGAGADYSTLSRPPTTVPRSAKKRSAVREKTLGSASRGWLKRGDGEESGDAPTLATTVAKAIRRSNASKFTALEHYLLGFVAYELDMPDKAMALLRFAQDGGLNSERQAKAQNLRQVCEAKIEEAAHQARVDRAADELQRLLGKLGPEEAEGIIRRLQQGIGNQSVDMDLK